MRYFWAICTECGDTWAQPCIVEHGMIVPESESCADCGGDIELTEDEYTPGEDRESERETPFDF